MKSRRMVNRSHSASSTRNSGEAGFVLYEALLAVLILSVGLVAISGVFQKATRAVAARKHFLEPARQLAQTLLTQQEMRALHKTEISTVAREGRKGPFRYRIERLRWPDSPGLERVEVTVSWRDRGKSGSVTLVTLLPRQR